MKNKNSSMGTLPASQKKAFSQSSNISGVSLGEENEKLEALILSSRAHYNQINALIARLREDDPLGSRLAALTLCRVFCQLISAGSLLSRQSAGETESVITRWLKDRLKQTRLLLLEMVEDGSEEQAQLSIDLLMQLLKEEAMGMRLNRVTIWNKGRLFDLVTALLRRGSSSDSARAYFRQAYAWHFVDVRFFTYHTFRTILSQGVAEQQVDLIITFLKELGEGQNFHVDMQPFIDKDQYAVEQGQDGLPDVEMKAEGEAWLLLLNYDLTKSQRKTLLELIPYRIAPRVQRPERLMDFLTGSFDLGGSTSLLALSGLYYLIQERNLDYPRFYLKLYSLLDASLLHSRHRSRFLRFLDRCLASTHLPAALVASFIKRMSRLCLHAPPPAIAVIVPWVYNLLINHPSCTFMIHRAAGTQSLAQYEASCPFKMDESDPMETGAIESSLWELETLQSHFHPNIATMCKIISEQFTKPSYNIEDFLDHSYSSMLESELSIEMRKPPVIEHNIPKRVFDSKDDSAGGSLMDLWDFSS